MTDSLRTALTDKIIKMEQYLAELKEAKPKSYSDYISNIVYNSIDKTYNYYIEYMKKIGGYIDLKI